MNIKDLKTAMAVGETLDHLGPDTPVWLEWAPGTPDPLIHLRSEQLSDGRWVLMLSILEAEDATDGDSFGTVVVDTPVSTGPGRLPGEDLDDFDERVGHNRIPYGYNCPGCGRDHPALWDNPEGVRTPPPQLEQSALIENYDRQQDPEGFLATGERVDHQDERRTPEREKAIAEHFDPLRSMSLMPGEACPDIKPLLTKLRETHQCPACSGTGDAHEPIE